MAASLVVGCGRFRVAGFSTYLVLLLPEQFIQGVFYPTILVLDLGSEPPGLQYRSGVAASAGFAGG